MTDRRDRGRDTCLPEGCYDLTVNDSFGDGICCAYGDGSYTLEVDGVVVATGGDFGDGETINTCTGGDIPGCTDADACNYSASATVDDGPAPTRLRTTSTVTELPQRCRQRRHL